MTSTTKASLRLAAAIALTAAAALAQAATLEPFFIRTFGSTANASGVGGYATYGVAYVGDEWLSYPGDPDMRGVIEFPLTAARASSATLNLSAVNVQYGSNFEVVVEVYEANGVQDYFADYQEPPGVEVGRFLRDDYVGIGVPVAVDVTQVFNGAVWSGWSALGVRLRQADETGVEPRAVSFQTAFLAVTPEQGPTGRVVAWGLDSYGQATVPPGLTAVSVAAGVEHSVALLDGGTVVAWGASDLDRVAVPPGLAGVTAVASQYYHSLALTGDGGVVAWGWNYYGQTDVPAGLGPVKAIAAGVGHSLALLADGTVAGWGDASQGQLDPPAEAVDLKAIAAGFFHSLGLRNDGTVVAWGRNDYGQATVPAGLEDVVAIAAGGYHSLALKADGTVVGWGDDAGGMLDVPSGLGQVVAIAAGASHVLALRADGTVVAWGYGGLGALDVPEGLVDVTAISAGWAHNLAVGRIVRTLSVSLAGGGSGRVSSSPAGIDCGTSCSSAFDVDTTVMLTASPADGMVFAGWTGACAGSSETCAVTVSAATSTTATFAPGYAITASVAGGSGTIAPAGVTVVPAGGSQTFSIAAAPGYRINDVAVNGASVGTPASYTLGDVRRDCTITADFVPITYTITVTQTAHGRISGATFGGFVAGASQTYGIAPDAGYRVADVLVDGASVGAVPSTTFADIRGDHTLTATFAANPSYTVLASAGPNGSISPAGATTLLGGVDQKYAIVPSSGYRVAAVAVDGVAVGPVTSYTFAAVSADHTIGATFAKDEYTLTASLAGGSGTIAPAGVTVVPAGGSQTFSIAPAPGYRINYVAVNGASVGTPASYTLGDVRRDCTIAADFVPITYTITVTQTAHGRISGATFGGFVAGASQTYGIAPDAGYRVADVLVDGASVGAVPSTTFADIRGDHTLTATFAPSP